MLWAWWWLTWQRLLWLPVLAALDDPAKPPAPVVRFPLERIRRQGPRGANAGHLCEVAPYPLPGSDPGGLAGRGRRPG